MPERCACVVIVPDNQLAVPVNNIPFQDDPTPLAPAVSGSYSLDEHLQVCPNCGLNNEKKDTPTPNTLSVFKRYSSVKTSPECNQGHPVEIIRKYCRECTYFHETRKSLSGDRTVYQEVVGDRRGSLVNSSSLGLKDVPVTSPVSVEYPISENNGYFETIPPYLTVLFVACFWLGRVLSGWF